MARQKFMIRTLEKKLSDHNFLSVISETDIYIYIYIFFNNIYLVTTLLMTILTFTWRKNKNNVQEIKEKYKKKFFS